MNLINDFSQLLFASLPWNCVHWNCWYLLKAVKTYKHTSIEKWILLCLAFHVRHNRSMDPICLFDNVYVRHIVASFFGGKANSRFSLIQILKCSSIIILSWYLEARASLTSSLAPSHSRSRHTCVWFNASQCPSVHVK